MWTLCVIASLCLGGLVLALSCPVTLRGILKALISVIRPRQRDDRRLHIVYDRDSPFCNAILRTCDILKRRYIPPAWGYIGHIQTMLYGGVGRFVDATGLKGERVFLKSHDGSTVSYDWFEPNENGVIRDEVMLVLPGINNSAENNYIRAFAMFSIQRGYRAAVLNHVGTLKNTSLTGHRIFSYGGTGDVALVYDDLRRKLGHSCKFVGVGYSMGAMILCRFLGEEVTRQENFLCAFSFCQLYDAMRAHPYLRWWREGLGFYIFHMTRRLVSLLRRHQDALFTNKFQELAPNLDLDDDRDSNGFSLCRRQSPHPSVWRAKHITELDEFYTRRVMGFASIEELHQWSACSQKLFQINQLPLVIVNARDDSLVPEQVYELPARYTQHNHNAMFIISDYGGHLGFFEGNFLSPAPLSWLDRLVFEYTDAVRNTLLSS